MRRKKSYMICYLMAFIIGTILGLIVLMHNNTFKDAFISSTIGALIWTIPFGFILTAIVEEKGRAKFKKIQKSNVCNFLVTLFQNLLYAIVIAFIFLAIDLIVFKSTKIDYMLTSKILGGILLNTLSFSIIRFMFRDLEESKRNIFIVVTVVAAILISVIKTGGTVEYTECIIKYMFVAIATIFIRIFL